MKIVFLLWVLSALSPFSLSTRPQPLLSLYFQTASQPLSSHHTFSRGCSLGPASQLQMEKGLETRA